MRSLGTTSSNWSASIAKGTSETRLVPMNFLFGKQNKPGVTNETRRNTLVQIHKTR